MPRGGAAQRWYACVTSAHCCLPWPSPLCGCVAGARHSAHSLWLVPLWQLLALPGSSTAQRDTSPARAPVVVLAPRRLLIAGAHPAQPDDLTQRDGTAVLCTGPGPGHREEVGAIEALLQHSCGGTPAARLLAPSTAPARYTREKVSAVEMLLQRHTRSFQLSRTAEPCGLLC